MCSGTCYWQHIRWVSRCDCKDESGCPGCIQTAGCASYNKVLCKAGAKAVLGVLVETECKTAEEHRAMWISIMGHVMCNVGVLLLGAEYEAGYFPYRCIFTTASFPPLLKCPV